MTNTQNNISDSTSFKDMMVELKSINEQIKTLDSNDLDQALDLYDKGMKLVIACREKLSSFDQKVQEIDAENN